MQELRIELIGTYSRLWPLWIRWPAVLLKELYRTLWHPRDWLCWVGLGLILSLAGVYFLMSLTPIEAVRRVFGQLVPPYVIEESASSVTIKDLQGTAARIEARIRIRALRRLEEIAWGRIGSTGTIRNLRFVAEKLASESRLETQDGLWYSTVLFGNALVRGDRATLLLEFDAVESAPEDKVEWRVPVLLTTDKVEVAIHVPSERPCKLAEAYSESTKGISAQRRQEGQPRLVEGGAMVIWQKSEPEKARNYTVVCRW